MSRLTRSQVDREATDIFNDFRSLLLRVRMAKIPVLKMLEVELRAMFLHAYVSDEIDPPMKPCGVDEADVATVMREYISNMAGFEIKSPSELSREFRERKVRPRPAITS